MRCTALQFDHAALPAFDVAATRHFYGEVLELPLHDAFSGDDWGGKPWLMLVFGVADGRQIALAAIRDVRRPDSSALPDDTRHLAFSVPGRADLEAWKRKLAAHHIDVREEDHGTQHSIYFSDPAGTVLEITTPASAGVMPPNPTAAAVVQSWLESERDRTGSGTSISGIHREERRSDAIRETYREP